MLLRGHILRICISACVCEILSLQGLSEAAWGTLFPDPSSCDITAFQHAVLFHKTTVRLTSGIDSPLVFYSASERKREHDVPCKVSSGNCGSHLFDEGRNMVLAFPASFQLSGSLPDELKSQMHIFYGSRAVDLRDGLPKWAGLDGSSPQLDEDGNPPG